MRSGRPPKPDAERRNRARATHDLVLLPERGPSGRVPKIPDGIEVSEATKDWWRVIWKTPMATMWHRTDAYALAELAFLRDKMLSGAKQLAPEVRRRESEFGLTLAGRKALRWVLPGEEHEHPGARLPDELEQQRRRRVRAVRAIDPPEETKDA